MEEFVNCNTQTIAELFNGGNSRAVVSTANNVVHSRLRHTTDAILFVVSVKNISIEQLQTNVLTN